MSHQFDPFLAMAAKANEAWEIEGLTANSWRRHDKTLKKDSTREISDEFIWCIGIDCLFMFF